jgi:hypothetical protein
MLAVGYHPYPDHIYKPWFIPASSQVVPMAQYFNARRMPYSLFVQRGMQTTWDFNRLFTNLPQQDLKLRMHDLIHQVFAMHPEAVAVKVFHKKLVPIEWLSAVGPQETWCERNSRGVRMKAQIFTEQSLCDLFDYIIDHTYVQFGGHIYQQHIGIPMGINFAVYLSNYYLFTYEYDFLHQLRTALEAPQGVEHDYSPAVVWSITQQPGFMVQEAVAEPHRSRWEPTLEPPVPVTHKDLARMLLDAYQYTIRYVDDLLSIANPAFASLLYTNMHWHGFHGIYPPQLQLSPGSQGHKVVYMDLHVEAVAHPAPEVPGGLVAELQTTLYDKCLHGPLVGLGIIKYPHIISNLSWQCKYNIIITEFHRFMRNITVLPNFCFHMARIIITLLQRGYQLQLLLARLQQLLRRHRYNWRQSWHYIFLEVLLQLGMQAAALHLDTVFPGLGLVLQQQIALAQQLRH